MILFPDNNSSQEIPKVNFSYTSGSFKNEDGKEFSYKLKVADTPLKRQIGLMNVPSMPDDEGMVFIFDFSAEQHFWMKNTIIPLDIIYIDENFEIKSVHENTTPYSEKMLPSHFPVKYVVELNSGNYKKMGLKIGDKLTLLEK